MGGNASSLRIEPTITIQGHALCTAEEECKTGWKGGVGKNNAETIHFAHLGLLFIYV